MVAKNKHVYDLNETNKKKIFKSVDTIINQDGLVNYPTEFLNSLELPELRPDNFLLKVGAVVIMLRNIKLDYAMKRDWR